MFTKYVEERFGWSPTDPNGPCGLSLFRYISKGYGCFYHHFSFEVGDGFTAFFWHDRWSKGVA